MGGTPHRARKARLAALVLAAVSLLACNLPVYVRIQQRQMDATIYAAMRRTLTVLSSQTPGPPLPGTPEIPVVMAPTITPLLAPVPGPTGLPPGGQWTYYTQPGDTLDALAQRFQVPPDQITADQALPAEGLLLSGIAVSIPQAGEEPRYPQLLMPDSEVIYSPSTVGFDTAAYIQQAGGYLSSYTEQVDGETLSGAEIISRVAMEASINPRLLLAVIEHNSGWVLGQPRASANTAYPIGFYVSEYRGLRKELSLAVRMLSLGYYGWRSGDLSELTFSEGGSFRIAPQINAGTVAVQYLFTKLLKETAWQQALVEPATFPALYRQMFGDPWLIADQAGPLFPDGLAQPELQLPFAPGLRWSYTGGPHISWGVGSPLGAIDFAPVTGEGGCNISSAWAQAAGGGVVARSARNVFALDLDGDGLEQTGWVLIYLHLASRDLIPAGSVVGQDYPLGHPSCEGGSSTGTHMHLARKYNGEWIAADGPLPMVLGGWQVVAGERPYLGFLVNGGKSVSAHPDGRSTSIVQRE